MSMNSLLEHRIGGFRALHAHPYLWLDATVHKIREGGRVVPTARVVAIGVSDAGHHSVLGCDTGPSEDHSF
jgi:putative transposase